MISRRDFLKAAGVVVLASHIPGFIPQTLTPDFTPLYGRMLTSRYGLWVDSVIPISETTPEGYVTPHGVIPRAELQPMLTPAAYSAAADKPAFTGEVTGAAAVLRKWCAGNAPILEAGRIGHGGVVNVVDRLDYDGITWYGVQLDDCPTLAWTHSAPITPLASIPAPLPALTLHASRADSRLTVQQHGHALFNMLCSIGSALPAGEYSISKHALTGKVNGNDYAPFITTFGDQLHVCGAYWHNRFGENVPGHAIHLPPYVAKWLYGATQNGARVVIT